MLLAAVCTFSHVASVSVLQSSSASFRAEIVRNDRRPCCSLGFVPLEVAFIVRLHH